MNALVAQTNTTTPTGTTSPNPPSTAQNSPQGGITPPSTITNRFSTEYPNLTPTWQMDGTNYSAQYTDRTTNMGRIVVYDKNGNVIRTESEMGDDTYPQAIGDYYSKNYPSEKDYTIWSSDDGKGNTTYYSKRKSGTVWFDKNGKYMTNKSNKNVQKPVGVK